MYYSIQDETTGRFLSRWSLTEDEDGRLYLTSWTGQLGATFYSVLKTAQEILHYIECQFTGCQVKRAVHIVKVNADSLPIGVTVRECIKE